MPTGDTTTEPAEQDSSTSFDSSVSQHDTYSLQATAVYAAEKVTEKPRLQCSLPERWRSSEVRDQDTKRGK